MWQADNVLQIASSALISQGEEFFVYRVHDNRVEKVVVTTGRRSGLWVEIEKGVAPGDMLVSHPGDDLEEGSKVKIQ